MPVLALIGPCAAPSSLSSLVLHLQVRADVSLMAQSAEQALRELGDPIDSVGSINSGASAGQLLLKLLSRFASNFCDMVDGRVHADESDDLLTEQMFGGARIQVRWMMARGRTRGTHKGSAWVFACAVW